MASESDEEKPLIRLDDTDAVVTDEDGTTRGKMAALSKGGDDVDDTDE